MQIIEFARIKEEFKADSLKYVGGKNLPFIINLLLIIILVI